MRFREWLGTGRACDPAIEWVGDLTLEQAWDDCPFGDWLEWVLDAAGADLDPILPARAVYDAAFTGVIATYDAAARDVQLAAFDATRSAYADAIRAAVPCPVIPGLGGGAR